MNDKPTCGPMYKETLEKYAGNDPALIRVFASGWIGGQAEKVYLGACRAAMFRPSQDRRGMILEIVSDVCQRYGLFHVSPIGEKQEIWICREVNIVQVETLKFMSEDSEQWHWHRAWLCGIPTDEVDVKFHLRAGHGARCD